MNDELTQYKEQCLLLSERLLCDLNRNKDDAESFFGGDIYKAYIRATEDAMRKTREVRNGIRNL